MKLSIELTKPFSDAVGKHKLELAFGGGDFEDLVAHLVGLYPKLKDEFYTEDGEMSYYMVAFVNGKSISTLEGMKTELKEDDNIVFLVPISGG